MEKMECCDVAWDKSTEQNKKTLLTILLKGFSVKN